VYEKVCKVNFQHYLTLNLLLTTIFAPPSNASKWQKGFNSAFKGLKNEFRVYQTDRIQNFQTRSGIQIASIEWILGLFLRG